MMKKMICIMLVCLMLGCSVFAEGILPSLDNVYGVPMPSLYTLLNRYPDTYEETEEGVKETWESLSDADFTAFGEHLSASGCEMLNYTSENGVFDAEVGKNGKVFHFIYDGATKQAMLVFPVGTYDEALFETERNYQNAKLLIDNGEYEDAYALLKELRGYRDVDRIVENDENFDDVLWKTPDSIVTYGTYEQDNNPSNGAEPIEWIVLKRDDDNVILISKYGLETTLSYNTEYTNVTWKKCTLREWLNDNFFNVAFTVEEQMKLITTDVKADKNPKYDTNTGSDTQDKVFLLSVDEVNQYFDTDDERICMPTKYAVANGVKTDDSGACWWWLRSPGSLTTNAANVYYDGSVDCIGHYVNSESGAVRPVIVLRLS